MLVCNENLSLIGNKVHVPAYDRSKLDVSIVHIGMGHFHRSHFLTYLDDLLGRGLANTGVFEVDIVPVDTKYISEFRKQDYLYSVLSFAPDGSRELRINGPIAGYANLTEDPVSVMDHLCSPETKLITLTITEKGYCYKDDLGSLDWSDKGIIHDLNEDGQPVTAVGCLSAALHKRFLDKSPVTIMSCDNVPENGKMLRECILQFCRRKYPECVSWIEESISFPCTMVDRITPGTEKSDIQFIEDEYGLEDRCPIRCEAFMQWVIEDDFCTEVPDFAQAGALLVEDVRPYELMKIRLLNGSHSALSYPSYMMGLRMVHDAAEDKLIKTFIRERYMEDISRTLPEVPGVDIEAYKDQLIERFSNHHIADTLLRLASDGSKKISNAIIRPLEEGLAAGLDMDSVILALSMWEYYFIFHDSDGKPMPIDDPKADILLGVADNPSEFLNAAGLSDKDPAFEKVSADVGGYLLKLREYGVEKVLSSFLCI